MSTVVEVKKTKKAFKPMKGEDVDVKHSPESVAKFIVALNKRGAFHVSIKHDGWRCVFKDGNIYSASMKQIPNKQLHEQYAWLKQLTLDENIILDCELDSPDLKINQISSILRTKDRDLGSIQPVFFDLVSQEDFDESFGDRFKKLEIFAKKHDLTNVEYQILDTYNDIYNYFQEVRKQGLEGIMIRSLDSPYVFKRASFTQGYLFKMKDMITYDAKILEVKFFKSRKESTKGEAILYSGKRNPAYKGMKMAGEFIALWKNSDGIEYQVKVSLSSMKYEEKVEVWMNKEFFIGKYVEFKALLTGEKRLPRQARYYRIRDIDKGE